MDVLHAEVVLLIGANPTVNHPVAATWMKNAAKNGTKLVIMDPRQSDLTRLAHSHLQFGHRLAPLLDPGRVLQRIGNPLSRVALHL